MPDTTYDELGGVMLRSVFLRRQAFGLKARVALRSSRNAYEEYVRNDHATEEQLRCIQDRRALEQARFAMLHTPFYRDLYRDAGFRPNDLRDPAAYSQLPTITKQDVRDNFDAFRSDEATAQNTAMNVTGGSTGEPLRLLRDLRVPHRALEWRLFRWWGIEPAVDIALVQRHTKAKRAAIKHNLMWWPSVRFQLDAFHMDDRSIDEFVAQWRRVEPGLLIGYAGAITELALALCDRQIALVPPRAVAVTAAPVTEPQRQSISEAFNAPVFDHYRSSEIPWIAGECSAHSGLHVFSDVRRVEILTSDDQAASPGTVGEVVVSDLTNRVFPMLRYRIGDRSAALDGSCPCGMSLPRIAPIHGRTVDALRLPNGQVVAGEGLAQIFSRNPHAVRQFQIHQLKDYSVVLKCVATDRSDSWGIVNSVSDELRSMLDHQVSVTCERVEQIPHIGGKVRCVVSDVA